MHIYISFFYFFIFQNHDNRVSIKEEQFLNVSADIENNTRLPTFLDIRYFKSHKTYQLCKAQPLRTNHGISHAKGSNSEQSFCRKQKEVNCETNSVRFYTSRRTGTVVAARFCIGASVACIRFHSQIHGRTRSVGYSLYHSASLSVSVSLSPTISSRSGPMPARWSSSPSRDRVAGNDACLASINPVSASMTRPTSAAATVVAERGVRRAKSMKPTATYKRG